MNLNRSIFIFPLGLIIILMLSIENFAEEIVEVHIGGHAIPIAYHRPPPPPPAPFVLPPPPPPPPPPSEPLPSGTTEEPEFNMSAPHRPRGRTFNRTRGRTMGGGPPPEAEGIKAKHAQETDSGGSYYPEPEDTDAKHGDPCTPTSALVWDYCERAKYPNKARMICATADIINDPNIENTCVCKFGKNLTNAENFRQLRYDPVTGVCLSPEGGICYVKFPKINFKNETERDASNNPVYEKSVDRAHAQCDNTNWDKNETTKLECSQPHPRRFSKFNPYNFYCLTPANRLPQEGHHGKKSAAARTIDSTIVRIQIVITLTIIAMS